MGVHLSILGFEGSHLNQAPEILQAFKYRDTGRDRILDDSEKALAVWYEDTGDLNRVLKVFWEAHGWTFVLDPELLLGDDEAVCEALAIRFQTRLCGFIEEETSGSYVFALYAPRKVRGWSVVEGEVQQQTGAPLPQETGLLQTNGFPDPMEVFYKVVGTELIFDSKRFVVKELDESQMAAPGTPSAPPPPARVSLPAQAQEKPKRKLFGFFKRD